MQHYFKTAYVMIIFCECGEEKRSRTMSRRGVAQALKMRRLIRRLLNKRIMSESCSKGDAKNQNKNINGLQGGISFGIRSHNKALGSNCSSVEKISHTHGRTIRSVTEITIKPTLLYILTSHLPYGF